MKRTVLIVIGIALVMVLLTVRMLLMHNHSVADERRWFAKALRYEFSARVDSVLLFNPNAGRLRCLLTAGDPQVRREDSLKRYFKELDVMYLIFKRSADSITFVLPNYANEVAKGDCVRVSSRENSMRFFRSGKLVVTDSLSKTLTGYGRPNPFSKRNRK